MVQRSVSSVGRGAVRRGSAAIDALLGRPPQPIVGGDDSINDDETGGAEDGQVVLVDGAPFCVEFEAVVFDLEEGDGVAFFGECFVEDK